MNDPKKDISKLQDEMDKAREDAANAQRAATLKPVVYKPQNFGLDVVMVGAGMLIVLGLSVTLASQLTKDQVTALTAGSIGGAGGLVIGYGLRRSKGK